MRITYYWYMASSCPLRELWLHMCTALLRTAPPKHTWKVRQKLPQETAFSLANTKSRQFSQSTRWSPGNRNGRPILILYPSQENPDRVQPQGGPVNIEQNIVGRFAVRGRRHYRCVCRSCGGWTRTSVRLCHNDRSKRQTYSRPLTPHRLPALKSHLQTA